MELNLIKREKELKSYKLILTITQDYSKAYLEVNSNNVTPNFGEFPTFDEIKEFIKDNSIVFGLIEDTAQSIARGKILNKSMLIAEQKDAENGKDAVIKYKYNLLEKSKFNQDENGNIDFKELNWFKQIREGEVLATKIPATPGLDGFNLKGEKISPTPGKDAKFRYGRNVEVSEDGSSLIALKSGRLEDLNGRLSVNNVLTISGDVDTSVGNVDFEGDVVIRGDIKSGYNINVQGSLEVSGIIEASNVKVGADLIVRGGIKGSEDTIISVNGSILCKFIENANVSALGDITSDFILHSKVSTSGKIILESKRSVIAGGSIVARDSITVNTLGSNMGTKTDVTLGIDIERSALLQESKNKLIKNEKRINQIVPDIVAGKDMFKKGKMDMIKKVEYIKMLKEYNAISGENEELKAQIQAVENEIKEYKSSFLRVKSNVYPGVRVIITDHTKVISDEIGPCKIFLLDGEIKLQKE